MPEDDERKPEDQDDGSDATDDDSDRAPKELLEETPAEIGRAGDEAADASEELKKDVRSKVDDAKEAT